MNYIYAHDINWLTYMFRLELGKKTFSFSLFQHLNKEFS
jgi:hypothetical protein